MNFALIGVGGFIAPRHLEAIKANGGCLVAAVDPKDSVGILDRYFPDVPFFTDFERFERHVDGLQGTPNEVQYVSVCSPNYLHLPHVHFGLRHGAHVICEKPLVMNEADLDEMILLEKKSDRHVSTVLQLRVHPKLLEVKKEVEADLQKGKKFAVDLQYITSRGPWYHESWKGDPAKSGGVALNIGVHFFDFLSWLFGEPREVQLLESAPDFQKGTLAFDSAQVRWGLSLNRKHLPAEAVTAGKTTYRSIKLNGREVEFSEGFTELHNEIYKNALSGHGFRPEQSRFAIRITELIRAQI